ncbi:ankyrin repeat domain-containing protein [bacterium]|nr:MAG: ankyrin repeat domain-containing protein [bacterium]
MKKFIGLFLVTFALMAHMNPAAQKEGEGGITMNVMREDQQPGGGYTPLTQTANYIMGSKTPVDTNSTEDMTEYVGLEEALAKVYVSPPVDRREDISLREVKAIKDVQSRVDFSTDYVSKSFVGKSIISAVEDDDIINLRWCIKARREDINMRDAAGNTPLHFATSVDCAKELVENGADANVANKDGNTPLHYAALRNSLLCVKYLVEEGKAFVLAMNDKGQTPYDLALEYNYNKVAKYLKRNQRGPRRKKLSLDSEFSASNMPVFNIILATEEDNVEELRACIKARREDINMRDAAGNTPLHFATSIDCAKELVEHGADANVTNKTGNTPLHYAVIRNSLPCVQYLIERGNASVWSKNNKGQAPYDVALERNQDEIAEYLKSTMKSQELVNPQPKRVLTIRRGAAAGSELKEELAKIFPKKAGVDQK